MPVFRASQSKLKGVAHERYRSGNWIESKPDSSTWGWATVLDPVAFSFQP